MTLYRLERRSGPSLILCIVLVSWSLLKATSAFQVIYAVNCGGPAHTDKFGIKYRRDTNTVGIASEYGKSMIISRVHPEDQILFQTERYHIHDFGYEVPVNSDGEYVLVLKFAEVYFQRADGKVGV